MSQVKKEVTYSKQSKWRDLKAAVHVQRNVLVIVFLSKYLSQSFMAVQIYDPLLCPYEIGGSDMTVWHYKGLYLV